MSSEKLVFIGVLVSPKSLSELIIKPGYLTVENGKITGKGTEDEFFSLKTSGAMSGFREVYLTDNQFLMPGLIDCHVHAPQFPNIGLGLDRPLLEWLDKYTFPLESKYSDQKFAKVVYDQVVQRLLTNGTTTACYFGSIHLEGTLELVKSVIKHGQRGLVGKVSMNVKNDAGYYNQTDKELKDVEAFVKKVVDLKNDLVLPVITPRFAISCSTELMVGLSRIAEKYGCRTQSHISENLKEIEYVLETNTECGSYAEVYDKSNILSNRCIMAHAVHLTDEEIAMLSSRGVSVAHCPASNTRLKSGLCPVRRLLNNHIKVGLGTGVSVAHCPASNTRLKSGLCPVRRLLNNHIKVGLGTGVSVAHCPASNTRLKSGLCPVRRLLNNHIKVGLGTDVAGGDSASILDAMRRCMDVSTHLLLLGGKETPIGWKEAICLATLGGAKALSLEDRIGSLEVGKEFDALLVDAYPESGSAIDQYNYSIDETREQKATSLVQRFLHLGDDRNILHVYVKGEKVNK